MKPFDYNKYLKNNPLLREANFMGNNTDIGGIENQLLSTIKGQNDDMSFLDGVSDEEFVSALNNLGIKYKVSDSGMSTDYYIGTAGNGIMLSNEDGSWFAGDWERP